MRDLAVAIMTWLHKNELRATRACHMRGERRVHAKRARLIAGGADHAALAIAVTHGNWLSGKRRIVANFYRRKEGVEINVKDAARRGRVRGRQPFLLLVARLASSSVQR